MNNDQYINKAKQSVVVAEGWIKHEDLYVVWFCKALGNWKALVSTDMMDGVYWEVTYNGAKRETYVDAYTKTANTCVKDADRAPGQED